MDESKDQRVHRVEQNRVLNVSPEKESRIPIRSRDAERRASVTGSQAGPSEAHVPESSAGERSFSLGPQLVAPIPPSQRGGPDSFTTLPTEKDVKTMEYLQNRKDFVKWQVTAFKVWRYANRAALLKLRYAANSTDLIAVLNHEWSKLSEDERRPYNEVAHKLNAKQQQKSPESEPKNKRSSVNLNPGYGAAQPASQAAGHQASTAAGSAPTQETSQTTQPAAPRALKRAAERCAASQAAESQPSQAAGSQPSQAAGYHLSQAAGYHLSQAAGYHLSQAAGYHLSQAAGYHLSQAAGYQPSQAAGYHLSQAAGYQPSQAAGYHLSQAAGYQLSQAAGYQLSQAAGYQPSQAAGYQPSQAAGYHLSQAAGYQLSQAAGYQPSQAAADLQVHQSSFFMSQAVPPVQPSLYNPSMYPLVTMMPHPLDCYSCPPFYQYFMLDHHSWAELRQSSLYSRYPNANQSVQGGWNARLVYPPADSTAQTGASSQIAESQQVVRSSTATSELERVAAEETESSCREEIDIVGL